MELNKLKEGTLLYHHLHGIVKLVKFNFGTCIVLKENWLINGWERITVKSPNLIKYNEKKHGIPNFN